MEKPNQYEPNFEPGIRTCMNNNTLRGIHGNVHAMSCSTKEAEGVISITIN
jgi:hypothetical protein